MTSTPNKAKDKERIIKLLHESILHLCKVSVSGPGNIEVDGIVCITQPNESDIVVKVHESFSNVHNEKDGDKSPAHGEKRKHSVDGESSKTPRKEGNRTPVNRRLMSGDTIDLSDDDDGIKKFERSPNRNKKSAVIDLTEVPRSMGHQMNITQVRSLQQQQRFSGNPRMQRMVNVRGRGGYQMMVPRQRFMGPGMRGGPPQGVRPIGAPIPARGFRPQGGVMMGVRGQMSPVNPVLITNPALLTSNEGKRQFDPQAQGYRGLRCKYKDCNFACSNKYYLETHVLQHFESDPFACNEEGCEFKSKNKQNLYQHYKTNHNSSNPQFCFKCIKAFKSPEDLAAHTQNCNIAEIKCDHCGEMIMGMMAMAKHLSDVYIAESAQSQQQTQPTPDTETAPNPSPGDQGSDHSHTSSSGGSRTSANTPSPGRSGSPAQQQQQQQQQNVPLSKSANSIPNMSAPLNIIPDSSGQPTHMQAPMTSSMTSVPEIRQLQQMAAPTTSLNEMHYQTSRHMSQQQQYPNMPTMSMNMSNMNNMTMPTMSMANMYRMHDSMGPTTTNMNTPPTLQPTLLNETYSNLELLNNPLSIDPSMDPIQMPSLGDPMCLPDPEQLDNKNNVFNT